jgi:hypothetical protein
MEAVLTTDSLSPNITVEWATGTEVSEGAPEINDLFRGGPGSNIFGSEWAVSTVDCSLVEKSITVWWPNVRYQ